MNSAAFLDEPPTPCDAHTALPRLPIEETVLLEGNLTTRGRFRPQHGKLPPPHPVAARSSLPAAPPSRRCHLALQALAGSPAKAAATGACCESRFPAWPQQGSRTSGCRLPPKGAASRSSLQSGPSWVLAQQLSRALAFQH